MITDSSDNTRLHVVLEVANRSELTALLETVDGTDLQIRTKNISEAQLSRDSSITLDLDILTDKQREALTLALEEGYYERPREADLGDLADGLEISKSAVSQRIRTAEIKLIKSAFQRYE